MNNLDFVIQKEYDYWVSKLLVNNIRNEREYFANNDVPLADVYLNNMSYYDAFEVLKRKISGYVSERDIERISDTLEVYYLFSSGYDMIYKHKLKADCFDMVPSKLIYKYASDDIKSKFNDVSVMKENPNYEKNMSEISKIMTYYIEFSSLLQFLYVNDWQFSRGWENMYPDAKYLLEIFKMTNITLGDFYYELIDNKCLMMEEVMKCISDDKLRVKYLKKVQKLKEEKYQTVSLYVMTDLPVNYYLDHTFDELLDYEPKSIITRKEKKTKVKKIIL